MKPRIERVEFAHDFLLPIFAGNLHAKRIESRANGALGVMTSGSLAVSIIGHSLAQARGLLDKHAIKQVDRLLSNRGIVVWEMFAHWVREVVGACKEIVVAMDWTDFDADDQTTLALNLVTRHGRATPLLWLTVSKDELKDRRNDWEDLCLSRLAEVLPEGVTVTILADRGFGDTKLFAFSTSWASPMSSGSAAISMSPRPPAKRATPPIGSARADERASCATPRSRRVGTRSARSSASMPST
jgi:hypothetical protein